MATKREAYCVYDTKESALVFYYGEKPEYGITIDKYLKGLKNVFAESCKYVFFDKSFKDYEPESCSSWFSDFVYLEAVFGLENLNVENTKDFSLMFNNCSNIAALDLSRLEPKESIKTDDMFNGCNNLLCIKGMKAFFGIKSQIPPTCSKVRYMGKKEHVERAIAASKK